MSNALDYGDISPRTAAYAYKTMEKHAAPVIVLGKFGQPRPLPKNKTDTVKFRRPVPLPISTAPLAEGVTPASDKMDYVDVTTVIKQYGRYQTITDKIMDTHEDPVLRDAMMLAGEQAAETLEAICYGVLKAGTSVLYANGTQRSHVNTTITLAKQRAVVRALKENKAKKIRRMIDPSQNYATRSIEPCYIAFVHTDCEADIRDLAGFVPKEQYGQKQFLCEEEFGAVEDVRYICSPDLDPFEDDGGAAAGSGTAMISTTGSAADVYPIIYVGADAYGHTHLGSTKDSDGRMHANMVPMVKRATVTESDPLAQRNIVSWKSWYAATRLNENWMYRLEVAATAL